MSAYELKRSPPDAVTCLQARLAIAGSELLKVQERLQRERHRNKLKVQRLQGRINELEEQVRSMTGAEG